MIRPRLPPRGAMRGVHQGRSTTGWEPASDKKFYDPLAGIMAGDITLQLMDGKTLRRNNPIDQIPD